VAIESLMFVGRGTDQTKGFFYAIFGCLFDRRVCCTMVTVTCKPFASRATCGRASSDASRRLPTRCSLNADEGPGSSGTSRRCSSHAGWTFFVWMRPHQPAVPCPSLRPDHPRCARIDLTSSRVALAQGVHTGRGQCGRPCELVHFRRSAASWQHWCTGARSLQVIHVCKG